MPSLHRRHGCVRFVEATIGRPFFDNPPPASREPPLHKGAFLPPSVREGLPAAGAAHFAANLCIRLIPVIDFIEQLWYNNL